MRATPANRQSVYRAVVAQWTDVGAGISVETVAKLTKLPEDVALSVLEVLESSGLLVRGGKDADHVIWKPAATTSVTVGRGAPAPRARSAVLR
jgi:hypothetical protein